MYYVTVFGLTLFVVACALISEHYDRKSKERVAYTLKQLDENKSVVAGTIGGMLILIITILLTVPLSGAFTNFIERVEYENRNDDFHPHMPAPYKSSP